MNAGWLRKLVAHAALSLSVTAVAAAQQPSPSAPPEPAAPHGTVLFERHGDSPAPDSDRTPMTAPLAAVPEVSDRDRTALRITAYHLDAHVALARSELSMRARVTLENASALPVARAVLQVSSTLHWQSVALVNAAGTQTLALAQHLIDTDADHTGQANELVVTLPHPLLPGASLTLDVFYAGDVPRSSERLHRIGAAAAEADSTDWDSIDAHGIALRGFGNVLWYPVASPAVFLGEGAALFDAVGKARLRNEKTDVRLRLAVDYTGDAPAAAYFCGKRANFTTISDDATLASMSGIATAEFALAPAGFRTLSLFTAATSAAAAGDTGNGDPLLLVDGASEATYSALGAAADHAAAGLIAWLGPKPQSPLSVIDHAVQPFQDGPLLVAPASSLLAPEAEESLVHSLAHAWVQTGQPWMDEGLAQFFALEAAERDHGRDAAVSELLALVEPVAAGEPSFNSAADVETAPPGQPLVSAWSDMFYRRKAAAVWWMLRDLAGENALKAALSAWCARPASHEDPRAQALAFETLLGKTSGKDLAWFFNDWVLRDVGLPDLTIVDVTPRPLPAGPGHNSGWLVAVTVRNDGAATADVPLIVRSGSFSTTHRMRIAGFATATERVLVEAPPTQVVLNDGTTPETRTSLHTRDLSIRTDKR